MNEESLATIASLEAALDAVAKMAGKLKEERDRLIDSLHRIAAPVCDSAEHFKNIAKEALKEAAK